MRTLHITTSTFNLTTPLGGGFQPEDSRDFTFSSMQRTFTCCWALSYRHLRVVKRFILPLLWATRFLKFQMASKVRVNWIVHCMTIYPHYSEYIIGFEAGSITNFRISSLLLKVRWSALRIQLQPNQIAFDIKHSKKMCTSDSSASPHKWQNVFWEPSLEATNFLVGKAP